jgi:hypothetical protein
VFVSLEFDAPVRKQMVSDLEAGFQPVVRSGIPSGGVLRLAA